MPNGKSIAVALCGGVLLLSSVCFGLSHGDWLTRLEGAGDDAAAEAVLTAMTTEDRGLPARFLFALPGARFRALSSSAVKAIVGHVTAVDLVDYWRRERLAGSVEPWIVDWFRERVIGDVLELTRIAGTATYDRGVDAWLGGEIATRYGFFAEDLEGSGWTLLTDWLRELVDAPDLLSERTAHQLAELLRVVLPRAQARSLVENRIGYLFYDLSRLQAIAHYVLLLTERNRFVSARARRYFRPAVLHVLRFLLDTDTLSARPVGYFREWYRLGDEVRSELDETSEYTIWEDLPERVKVRRARGGRVTVASRGGAPQVEFFESTRSQVRASSEALLPAALTVYSDRNAFYRHTPVPPFFQAIPGVSWLTAYAHNLYLAAMLRRDFALSRSERARLWEAGWRVAPIGRERPSRAPRPAMSAGDTVLDLEVEISEARQLGAVRAESGRWLMLFLPRELRDHVERRRVPEVAGWNNPFYADIVGAVLAHPRFEPFGLPPGLWIAAGGVTDRPRTATFVAADEYVRGSLVREEVDLYPDLFAFARGAAPFLARVRIAELARFRAKDVPALSPWTPRAIVQALVAAGRAPAERLFPAGPPETRYRSCTDVVAAP